ncbi:MAG: 4-hydroxythreonine-4-phosphate dehydrogenase PdxA [Candidatus Gorgyraea atricola]|nr:4-hydroxythreonine-4-phosphate dehydrogenase PdxA [Candidatus Gorgyraea atricola]
MKKPRILLTTGDPRGIGPEVTRKALRDPHIKGMADFFVIEPRDKTGFDAIKKAVAILKRGGAEGLVTAPVNKSAINRSGIAFKGHTEYLAKSTRTKKFAMMFCGGSLKVTLVTRHEPIKNIPRILTKEKIIDAIILTEKTLKAYFRIKNPKIGVCGLNPHAGEEGMIGVEEKRVIAPAIKKLKSKIPNISGPLPADTAFHMAYNKGLDAIIAMYHDQGLAPFKMVAFHNGVNVTLGLPFVRTSPDHGTAYGIAGKGIANPTSMKEAIKLNVKLTRSKMRSPRV